jgi:hypothetical protein
VELASINLKSAERADAHQRAQKELGRPLAGALKTVPVLSGFFKKETHLDTGTQFYCTTAARRTARYPYQRFN